MTVLFKKVADLPSVGRRSYAVMVFAALLPWQFFANALTNASQSLVGNANMISKVYFPRIIVPASAVMVSLADFFISFLILGGLMAWFQFLAHLADVHASSLRCASPSSPRWAPACSSRRSR